MLDNVGCYLSGFLCVKGFFLSFFFFAINTVWKGILELYNFLKYVSIEPCFYTLFNELCINSATCFGAQIAPDLASDIRFRLLYMSQLLNSWFLNET